MNIKQPEIKLEQTTGIVCENCGGRIFNETFMLRKAHRMITLTPKDVVVPVPVISCATCHHVNKDMMSPDLLLMLATEEKENDKDKADGPLQLS